MMEKTIYPEVNTSIGVLEDTKVVSSRTHIRKKHRNKWYLWPVFRQTYFNTDKELTDHFQDFQRDVYFAQQLGIISKENSFVVFNSDDEPEQDRLFRMYPRIKPKK